MTLFHVKFWLGFPCEIEPMLRNVAHYNGEKCEEAGND